MRTQSFHSKAVRSAVYCEDTEALTIYFTNGRKPAYYCVPVVVAEQLFNIADPAKFVPDFIDSAYFPLHVSWKSVFQRRKDHIEPEHAAVWLEEIGTTRHRRS